MLNSVLFGAREADLKRFVHTTPQLHCSADILITFCHKSPQVKMNLTFMRHRNAVTLQFLCSRVQCGNTMQLRSSMIRPKLLQHLQNEAARLVFPCGWDRCSVELLNSLHWLQVKDCVCFKMMLYVCKCITGLALGAKEKGSFGPLKSIKY